MFFQPPEKVPKHINSSQKSNKAARRKRKRKLALQAKKLARVTKRKLVQGLQKQSSVEISMSSWAENFTNAATWQLKHQVAHWKARVKALEYENKVLRDTLWNYYTGDGSQMKEMFKNDQSSENDHNNKEIWRRGESSQTTSAEENAEEINKCNSEISDNDSVATEDISVDEGYIDYMLESLACREERARTAKAEEKMREPSPEPENNLEDLKELYGSGWQRIAALETSLMANFISECDKEKPAYWPNMPMNC